MWYPGARGGKAVADILFGKYSPSGKLPITFYKDLEKLPDFQDYSMKGRTYRFMEEEALYPFGFGLTYSKVKIVEANFMKEPKTNLDVEIEVKVLNEGLYATDEVIEVYIKDLASEFAVRNYSLCGFQRITLNEREEKELHLTIPAKAFQVVDEEGAAYIDSTEFILYVGISQPDRRSTELTGMKPLEMRISFMEK